MTIEHQLHQVEKAKNALLAFKAKITLMLPKVMLKSEIAFLHFKIYNSINSYILFLFTKAQMRSGQWSSGRDVH